MIQNDVLEKSNNGHTVMVGVKLDGPSRELLTWALVKAAHPADTVIALHVLEDEIVDGAGTNSLLSLVRAFDCILDAYEGFCNLKQVDLKLKVCRGSSIRKILVREANSICAAKIIVGTSRSHHTIRSSTSIAKYCAKKSTKSCLILAINNGKIVYQKQISQSTPNHLQGKEDAHRNNLLNVIHRIISLSKNTKVVCDSDYQNLGKALTAVRAEDVSVCGSDYEFPDVFKKTSNEESSVTMLVRQIPEAIPGWPLLGRALQSSVSSSSFRKISVVQWALRLPSRNTSLVANGDFNSSLCTDSKSSCMNDQTGAIVPVGVHWSPISLPEEFEGLQEKYSASCRLFRYQELVLATANFSSENLIGKGGSSRVYKGRLLDGTRLAVKILNQTEDVKSEFVSEIEIITALHHKNIIPLSGFCFEDGNLVLVYDFLPRGSLEENLHGIKKDPTVLCWGERYKVAVGVAEALDYLHNYSDQPVIHRDVKSSNILLTHDFEPQLSDFGLAKWASTSSDHLTCIDVAGTFGYLAPEYFMYGKVNNKIEVYAFGVVLLELLSGRKPIDNSDSPEGQESLVMWAKPILEDGKYLQLLDQNLGDNYSVDEVGRLVLAAALCLRRAPQARPDMNLVVKLIKGEGDVVRWARQEATTSSKDQDVMNDEFSMSNMKSHLDLAMLDVEEDETLSPAGCIEPGVSWQDYLRGRWSRSSSFD